MRKSLKTHLVVSSILVGLAFVVLGCSEQQMAELKFLDAKLLKDANSGDAAAQNALGLKYDNGDGWE
jgi:hypothetical protein